MCSADPAGGVFNRFADVKQGRPGGKQVIKCIDANFWSFHSTPFRGAGHPIGPSPAAGNRPGKVLRAVGIADARRIDSGDIGYGKHVGKGSWCPDAGFECLFQPYLQREWPTRVEPLALTIHEGNHDVIGVFSSGLQESPDGCAAGRQKVACKYHDMG